jgi:hypothetical protein
LPILKNFIRSVLRALARLPVIGRFVRMAAALYRIADQAERSGHLTVEMPKPAPVTPDADRDNLIASIPVTLRKLRRDLDEMAGKIERLEARLDQREKV